MKLSLFWISSATVVKCFRFCVLNSIFADHQAQFGSQRQIMENWLLFRPWFYHLEPSAILWKTITNSILKNKTAYLMQFSILTFIYSPIVWTLQSFDLKMIDSCLLRMRAHEWDDNKIRNFIIKALFKNINFIFLPSKYELWLVSRSIII